MESIFDELWQTLPPFQSNTSLTRVSPIPQVWLPLPLDSSMQRLLSWVLLTTIWPLLTLLCYSFYRPKALPKNPMYKSVDDVTIVVATIDTDDKLPLAIGTWLTNPPKEIIIVTTASCHAHLERVARKIDPKGDLIQVKVVDRANKRLQLAAGISAVTTRLFVTCDDDVFWPEGLLPRLLACFEDEKLGGATVAGGVAPIDEHLNSWEILGDLRMTTLGVIRCASSAIDGGITALSGRTSAYRTHLFKEPGILDGFVSERWMGKHQVSSADGCALTKSIVERGWKTYMQKCRETELLTTVKNDWTWLLQVVRWSRDHWRQNIRALFFDINKTLKYPFTTGGRIHEALQPFSTLVKVSLIIVVVINRYQQDLQLPLVYEVVRTLALLIAAQVSQMIMLLPHLLKKPEHFLYFPVWGLYCYFRGFISIYALFTLHKTGWGTRKEQAIIQ